jgi:hypothetical protein
MHATTRVTQAVDLLKGMFLEVPGTTLSIDDAARLSGLEPTVCVHVLEALEYSRFLRRRADGLFVRMTADSPWS